jgi:signal transduction histidine kinase
MPEGPKRAGMAADLAEMEVMIGELLELERLRAVEGKEGGIRTTPTDLVAILDAVAAGYRDRPPGVEVEVDAAMEAGAIVLPLDADKMRIVFRNLVENAVKYSLPDSRPVRVSAVREGYRVVVRVRDDGPGIPAADAASVFEPFFRVDRSRSKKTGGYGLGLSIAKRIVEAHGGTIAVHDNPGRGATFEVSLPGA